MEALKSIAILLVGFVLLVKGADFFVDGASSIAKKLRIPSLIIGLTVVALGTSLPELSVSVTAALNNQNSLAISNVIGSNIFNLMMVLGVCAVIAPIPVGESVIKRDYPFSVICAFLLALLGYIGWELGHIDGIILLVFFIGYMVFMVRKALAYRKMNSILPENPDVVNEAFEEDFKEEEIKVLPMWQAVFYVIGGAVAVKFGGDFTVDGAVDIATMIGISDTLIGLTIVALGTSLPELVTSIVASRKNELDMAVGNVVGSNVFNILMILGVGATITPIAFTMENLTDMMVLAGFSIVVWLYCSTKKRIGKFEGASMLCLYGIYLAYIIMR